MTEQEKQLEENGQLMVRQAEELTVKTDEDYASAGKVLVEIKTRIKQVQDYWSPLKKNASEAHKALCNREKEMLQPLKDAETVIKKTMLAYTTEVERKRRAEAPRLSLLLICTQ